MLDPRPEDGLKATLTNAFSRCRKCVQEIESHGTAVGIPDIYVGKGIWIETKAIDAQFPSTAAIPFRRGQYPWLLHHAQDGGCSIVAILWRNDIITVSHVQELVELRDGSYCVNYYASTTKGALKDKKEIERILQYIGTAPLPF